MFEFQIENVLERNCNLRQVFAFLREDISLNENLSAVAMIENREIDLYSIPIDMTFFPTENRAFESTKAVRSSA